MVQPDGKAGERGHGGDGVDVVGARDQYGDVVSLPAMRNGGDAR